MPSSRLSGAVAFATRSLPVRAFLLNPGIGYVQAYVRFKADMPDDVIMFVDQEWLEGVDRPKHVSGGDWMALVGVRRDGAIWVGAGTGSTTPSQERAWQILSGPRLQPDTWYRLRVEADFGKLRFRKFSIQGGTVNRFFPLDAPLDYPNYMPFSQAGMIYIVGAMRSRDMARGDGAPIAYFDTVEGGQVGRPPFFSNGFENQDCVGAQPTTFRVGDYTDGKWYLEREESLFRIEKAPFARVGSFVGVADARLDE